MFVEFWFFPLLGFENRDLDPAKDLYPLLSALSRDDSLVDFFAATSAFPATQIANIVGVGLGGHALAKKLSPVISKLSQVAEELEGSKSKDRPAKGNELLGLAMNPLRDCFGRLSLSQGRPLVTLDLDKRLRVAAPMKRS